MRTEISGHRTDHAEEHANEEVTAHDRRSASVIPATCNTVRKQPYELTEWPFLKKVSARHSSLGQGRSAGS